MISWVARHGMAIVMSLTLTAVGVVIFARGWFIFRGYSNDERWKQDQMFWHAVASIAVPIGLALAISWASPGG